MPINLQILMCIVPTDIPPLGDQNVNIKPRKLALTYYCHLMLISYSCVANCLNIIFIVKESCMVFT